jgi:hypothetical protein
LLALSAYAGGVNQLNVLPFVFDINAIKVAGGAG